MSDATIHIHQCPYCEARFLFVNEVRDHVIRDHKEHAEAFATVTPHERP
jgi:hypothetical protein